jgi:hypothetical protein
MKRTTIFLNAELLKALKRLASRRGVSFATVVREAMSAYVAKPTAGSSVPSVAGRFASGTTDTSSRVDELLWASAHE